LDNSGNLGIGTVTPATKLEVYGVVRITESASGGILQMQAGSSALDFASTFYGGTYRPFTFTNGGSERMRIQSDGNVGIGTTSPVTQLHVSGSLQIGNGTNYGNKFTLYDDFSSGKLAYVMRDLNSDDIFGLYCNSTTGEVRLLADDDNGTAFMTFQMNSSERMRITNGGNVGIGTAGPSQKLVVADNGTVAIQAFNLASNADAYFIASNSVGSTYFGINATGGYIYNFSSIPILFYTSGSERMRITADGNVGIGTTNASNKLEVRGGIQLLNSSGSTSAATSASLMILGQNTLGGSSYHDFLYVRNTLSTTITPQKTFRLNNSGSIEIVNNAYTSIIFSLTDAGVLSTPGGGTSDIRTKQNVEYIYEDASTTINKLKPVKFEFKDYPNVKRHGFIAQDVLPIKPELVLGDGDKEAGTYGLDYDGILALTVKALQEANIKTKQLENKIETLEARLSVLENK
jgi:hypothetical protein